MTEIIDKMIEAAAKSMQEMFPLINTGVQDNGEWGAWPLHISIFKRAAEAALRAAFKNIREEDNEWDAVDILHDMKDWAGK